MAKKLVCLLKEANLKDAPLKIPYPSLLKDLSCEALQRRPLYNYRGKSAEEVRCRIAEVRSLLLKQLHIPKSSLRAHPRRVVSQPLVRFEGYSIQPVALERNKGWWITSHLYIPDGLTQPAPAVLHVHGHGNGKVVSGIARRCRGLARRGFVSLVVDFPNASERHGTGHALWYPTMVNLPLQRIMVEDNIVALSYLTSLSMVDGSRVGVMGSSGGGNQTAFLSAVDDRVAAAAPTCAPTLFCEHATTGDCAYCHCEIVPGLIGAGVEYHDLLAAMAPRTVCVFAGIRDSLFPIIGARKAVAEASFAYRALGAERGCKIEEHYSGHSVPDAMRVGTYQFFEDELKRPGDLKGSTMEGDDIDLLHPRLRAFPKKPARFVSVADLYRSAFRQIVPKKIKVSELNRLLGRKEEDGEVKPLTVVSSKACTKVVLGTRDGGIIPLAIQGEEREKVTLIIADGGKDGALKFAGKSFGRVVVFDWRGQGETSHPDAWWSQRATHYLSMAGQSLAGGRVTDLIAVVNWLRQEKVIVHKTVAWGGEASILALLALVADPHFPKVELHGLIKTFKDAPGLGGKIGFTAWVPGLARVTDIPQLIKTVANRVKVQSWLRPEKDVLREGLE